MPAWLLAPILKISTNPWVQKILAWIASKLWNWFLDHVRALYLSWKQKRIDEANGREMRRAVETGAPREERDQLGTDLLNGD